MFLFSVFSWIVKCYDLAVGEFRAVYGQSYECSVSVPPLYSSRAGVDVQQVEAFVVLYFQDVRMSADEQLGRRSVYLGTYTTVVVAGIAADMFHQDIDIFALEAQYLGVHEPQVAAVAVAANSPQRSERRQTLC